MTDKPKPPDRIHVHTQITSGVQIANKKPLPGTVPYLHATPAREHAEELLETLMDVLNQACAQSDGTCDHLALSAYENAFDGWKGDEVRCPACDLLAKLAEAERDVARLDWLEANAYTGDLGAASTLPNHDDASTDWRAVIDAAMADEGGE